MRRLTLIYPSMGRRPTGRFVRSWQWEPLAIGVLGSLTPPGWEVRFLDDRMERIDFDSPTDLVGISIETYSARRGYQIADEYRNRNVPVVFGGFHATACPEEALSHGNAVCVGEAEGVWSEILEDASRGRMRGRYEAPSRPSLRGVRVARRLFEGKGYLPIGLVEVGRGCPMRCDFCSISSFYAATYRRRPVQEIAEEVQQVGSKIIFLVDDNLTGPSDDALELFEALERTGKQWLTQTSMTRLENRAFARAMRRGGCIGVLIGFESLAEGNLAAMNKRSNRIERYATVIENLREEGIFVYGTFLFGYPGDTPETFEKTVDFAIREKLFIAAFNQLVPFPGTPLYSSLVRERRMTNPRWWLDEHFRFGQVPFAPVSMTASDIEEFCMRARRRFYSTGSIFHRAMDFRCNCASPRSAFRYFSINRMMGKEVAQKYEMSLGFSDS